MQPHAIRHLSFSLSKANRAKSRHCARILAYILRSAMTDPRTERRYNYSSEGGIIASGMVGWKGSMEELVAEVVFSEKRCDAVEGRVIIAALPDELPEEKQQWLLEELARHLSEKFKVACIFALHRPDPEGDQRNGHGHLFFTSRFLDESGKQLKEKTRDWDTSKGRKLLEELRAWWCAFMNKALVAAGHFPNLEHRSFLRLGIDQTPGRHQGERKTAQKRRKAKLEAVQQPVVSVSVVSTEFEDSTPTLAPVPVAANGVGLSLFSPNRPWLKLNAPAASAALAAKPDEPKPAIKPLDQPVPEPPLRHNLFGSGRTRPPLNAPRVTPVISPHEPSR